MAEALGADLYEIKAKVPYTREDLDWRNSNSRSSIEMRDKTRRVEIADDLSPETSHDTVFLLFPIWGHTAPTIINTFLEKYDFNGKKLVLFATSGGSDLGGSANELKASAEGAKVINGGILNGLNKAEIKALAEKFI